MQTLELFKNICKKVDIKPYYLAQFWDCEPDSRCEYVSSRVCYDKKEAVRLSSSQFKKSAEKPIYPKQSPKIREDFLILILLSTKKSAFGTLNMSYQYNDCDEMFYISYFDKIITKKKTYDEALYWLIDKGMDNGLWSLGEVKKIILHANNIAHIPYSI